MCSHPQGSRTGALVVRAALPALAVLTIFAPGAEAATFTVTSTAGDDTPGGIRQAITALNASPDASNTLVFAAGVTGTIQLNSPLQRIVKNVDIVGPGASQLTIRGQGSGSAYRVFELCREHVNGFPAADASVTISGLTISNGGAGGIFVDNDIPANGIQCGLTLNDVVVSGNSINQLSLGGTATALGGGVFVGVGSALTLINTTVSGNSIVAENSGAPASATARGGGIFTEPNAFVTILNSTISGNSATARGQGTGPAIAGGGGIYAANATIANSTISGNSASSVRAPANGAAGTVNGGGLAGGAVTLFSSTVTLGSVSATGGTTAASISGANVAGLISPPAVTAAPSLQNTIVSTPTGATNCAPGDNGGSAVQLSSLGNNLSSDASCPFGKASDFQNTDPLLGALTNNGGPTETHLPLDGSIAIDRGSSNGLTTDQRGEPRPIQHLGPIQEPVAQPALVNPAGGDGADIGAVEVQGPFVPGPPILRKIHFSLRFKFVDKHGRRFVTARVFCHSIACVLEGSGRIRILPFKPEKGKRRTGIQTFKLGDASGSYLFTPGRKVAGTLRFKVDAKTAGAVKRAILAGARGNVLGDIRVNGVNTFQPDLNKHRFRDIKLFARSRGGS